MLLYGSANRDERQYMARLQGTNFRRPEPGADPELRLRRAPLSGGGGRPAGRDDHPRADPGAVPGLVVDAASGRFAPGPYVRRYETCRSSGAVTTGG